MYEPSVEDLPEDAATAGQQLGLRGRCSPVTAALTPERTPWGAGGPPGCSPECAPWHVARPSTGRAAGPNTLSTHRPPGQGCGKLNGGWEREASLPSCSVRLNFLRT